MKNEQHISQGALVVEADPDLQCQLARLLKAKGYTVVGTSSGDGALTLLSNWPVALVIVAEDLPGMDGVTLARRVLEKTPNVSIVLTLNDDDDVRRDEHDVRTHARLAGVSSFLTQPVSEDELSLVLGARSGAGVLSASPASSGLFSWPSSDQDAAE